MIPVGVPQFSTALKNRLSDITQGAYDALGAKPSRVYMVAPGSSVAWDGGCDGQLWTRLTSLAPAPGSTPDRRQGLDLCAVPFYVATVELGIIRCAAVVSDSGKPPRPGEIIADGFEAIDDMSALLGSLTCRDDIRSVTAWTPQGPEGGYHGGYWTFTLRVENCITCQEESIPEPEPVPTPEG